MKTQGVLVVVFVAACTAAFSAQGSRTVWDGVYTAEQATRGEKVYMNHCARCHGDTALGGEGPALTGPLFAANWEGVALQDLFERIRLTMPADNPGVLTRDELTDLVSHLLRLGKMPAGMTPLPNDAGTLMQIKYVSTKPQ